jgi:putative DNA primase/helicase
MASQSALRDTFRKKHPDIRYGLGEWRHYEGGIWQIISRLTVEKHIQILIQESNTKLSHGLVTSVLKLLEGHTNILDGLFDANPNILTFANCCLDLSTYSQVAHSPEYYSTVKHNFNYDPSVRSEAWNRVSQSFPYIDVLQRFAGLSLTIDTKYEIALWLHGPPGGGKSTFIAGLEAMLGPKCCVLGLEDITSKFGLAQLPGKTLAVSTEQPAHFIKCSHRLNTIISGESLAVERKYAHAFTITPRVKLLWAMNELPQIPSGAGAGLFRRVYPIYWPAISESERDPEIKSQIQESGMAITNWALDGLKKMREQRRFVFPQEVITARNDYQQQSDLTACFIMDCCDRMDEEEAGGSSLYEAYSKWAITNGHHAIASNRFAADLERLGLQKHRKSIGVFWSGITLKADFPDTIPD